MKIKDQDAWQVWKDNNTDMYGAGVLQFAELWADKMEEAMANGEKLEDVAKKLSFIASDEAGGITGFMYGAGVSVLFTVWEHGDQLRQWHNLDTQIGTEGEKANEEGGVLNPALLNIEV